MHGRICCCNKSVGSDIINQIDRRMKEKACELSVKDLLRHSEATEKLSVSLETQPRTG